MSDASQGPGWWQASDGKWYPPEQQPAGGQQPGQQPAGGASGAVMSQWGPLADWPTRALGYLIDFGFVFVVWIAAFILVAMVSIVSNTLGSLLGFLVWIVLSFAWLYLGYLVGEKGRSPGMAIMGLRCISEETGQTLGGGMGVVRTLAHIVDSIICYIGWLFPLWDEKRQTIADKLVKTVVLAEQPKEQFSVDLLKP